jgi:hypothetical protein
MVRSGPEPKIFFQFVLTRGRNQWLATLQETAVSITAVIELTIPHIAELRSESTRSHTDEHCEYR